jgi:hypothetical protein
LDLKFNSIEKFEFKSCNKCNFFKVIINDEILFHNTTRKVLKYLYLKQNIYKHYYLYEGRLVKIYRMANNDIYYDQSILIKLKNNKNNYNYFYYFNRMYDKRYLNV